MWVFGYGSIMWRPDFPYRARHPAYVCDWSRRFYQGSTDHRGVPGSPGRVVTLVRELGARCYGVAYEVEPEAAVEITGRLDHREKGGYQRLSLEVHLTGESTGTVPNVLVYIATEENPNYLGPASASEIAAQAKDALGPSGPNREYILELARTLKGMNAHDDHVFSVEAELLSMITR